MAKEASGGDSALRFASVPKEAYLYGKRCLFIWQTRPIYMAKEAYLYGKRGLFIWQKRPLVMTQHSGLLRLVVFFCHVSRLLLPYG